jgi:hypothetical protein
MDSNDIKSIEKLLCKQNKSHLVVFEWGAGGSTKYFTEFLIANKITYDWTSAEFNKQWYKKVDALNLLNVNIKLFDVGNTQLKQRNTNMDDYVGYPLTMNRLFDFIIVDGRKRRRCLINAAKVLSSNGCVILHDAQRKYYHCAFDQYSDHKFLSKKLWSGICPI